MLNVLKAIIGNLFMNLIILKGKRVDGPLYPFMKGSTTANKPTKKDVVPPSLLSQQQHQSRSIMRTYNDTAFDEDEIDWDDDDFPEDDDFLSLVEAASMPSNRYATDDQEGKLLITVEGS